MQCEVGGIGTLPLGKKPLSIPPLELFIYECALLCPLSPLLCGLTKYTLFGTVLGPTLTVGVLAIGPSDPQTCCFHQAMGTDPLKSDPKTAIVMHLDPLCELWRQLRLWPG